MKYSACRRREQGASACSSIGRDIA
jgi:hypothetical protein